MKIMTPGPTQVRENVRMARSIETTNPDLDLRFYEYYKDICDHIGVILNTKDPVYVLSGEGILGLEAACASLTEPGDRVLVLDNGIFGKGFADFVSLYGGKPVLYTVDDRKTIDVVALKQYLERDHNFKYATIVHCDTPSGVLNDIATICPLLKSYGIMTVVDAVSSMFGELIDVEHSQIDILCGGSQKALSAPPGLTMVAVSHDAIMSMEQRKVPIASFYANLLLFKNYYVDKWFPYTMPMSDIYGLGVALDNIKKDKEFVSRHGNIGQAVRDVIIKAGLSLYTHNGYSNTVTVICVPQGISVDQLLLMMQQQYGVMIAGCFGYLAGKVIRIGHMGEGCNISDVAETLDALGKTLQQLGFAIDIDMKEEFIQQVNAR